MADGMRAPIRPNGSVPTSAIGHPDVIWGMPGQGGLLTEWAETVPDLTWPESIRTYGRMRRDSHLTAVLQAYFLPILRTHWAVDPAGVNNTKAVELVAGDLGLPILGEEKHTSREADTPGFRWIEHLRLALLHLVYGHFPFERWYDTSGRLKDGLTHLGGVAERQPHTIAIIDINDDGSIREVTQNTQLETLPANRLLWYVNDREGANWAGVSLLRSCYTPWILKHETMRVHATSIRRFGMGVPNVEAPPGATPAQVTEAQRLAAGMRVGDQQGAGLPAGFKFNLTGLTGSVPDAVGFLDYLNTEMATSALAGIVTLGRTGYGPRALGETFLDLFLLSLQATADAIGDVATFGDQNMPGLAKGLVEVNFGEGEPVPRIVATDVGDRHEVTSVALATLVTSGALQPDPTLDAFIRDSWGLPERSPDLPWTPPAPKTAPHAPNVTPGMPNPPGQPPEPGKPSSQTQQPVTPPPAGPGTAAGTALPTGPRRITSYKAQPQRLPRHAMADFNPAQPRGEDGKWIGVGGDIKHAVEEVRRTSTGRLAAQTPSQFTHPDTGHLMGKTEIGDTFEALFASKAVTLLTGKFGGPYKVTSGGGGPRNTPLDFQLDDSHAGELKTLNARAVNKKTAIKAAEARRKEQAAFAAGLDPLLVVQVVDMDTGTADVYTWPGFVSRHATAMDHLGSYTFDPADFQAAQEATGHWDQRGQRAQKQGLVAAASDVPPDEDPQPQPGDTVIELRGSVPWISTQPATQARARGRPPGRPRDARGRFTAAAPGAPPGLRRPLTTVEAAAGLDPLGMRAELERARDAVLNQWAPVLRAQCQDLTDQVAQLVDAGKLGKLATLQTGSADGAAILTPAMVDMAHTAARRVIGEAASQGVDIDPGKVKIDDRRLGKIAVARAAMAAGYLADQAGKRALRVVAATPGDDAAREVRTRLDGLSPVSLEDQLMAAMMAAQNMGRVEAYAAGPGAVYFATEILDRNTCDPCKAIDGHRFGDLADAEAAYINGAYIGCLGELRCRGTVMALWEPVEQAPYDQAPYAPGTPGGGRSGDHGGLPGLPGGLPPGALETGGVAYYGQQTTQPPPATASAAQDVPPGWDEDGDDYVDVSAAFDPAELRDAHGKWTKEGLIKKIASLKVRQRVGFNGHDIDRTASKGYRVRLKTGEVQHYEKPEDAGHAAYHGKHFTPGGQPKEEPAPKAPPKARRKQTPEQVFSSLTYSGSTSLKGAPRYHKAMADALAALPDHIRKQLRDEKLINHIAVRPSLGRIGSHEGTVSAAGWYNPITKELRLGNDSSLDWMKTTAVHETLHAYDTVKTMVGARFSMKAAFRYLGRRLRAEQPSSLGEHFAPKATRDSYEEFRGNQELFAELGAQYLRGKPYAAYKTPLRDRTVRTPASQPGVIESLDAYFGDVFGVERGAGVAAAFAALAAAAGEPASQEPDVPDEPDEVCVAVVGDDGTTGYQWVPLGDLPGDDGGEEAQAGFNPDEPRGPDGKWIGGEVHKLLHGWIDLSRTKEDLGLTDADAKATAEAMNNGDPLPAGKIGNSIKGALRAWAAGWTQGDEKLTVPDGMARFMTVVHNAPANAPKLYRGLHANLGDKSGAGELIDQLMLATPGDTIKTDRAASWSASETSALDFAGVKGQDFALGKRGVMLQVEPGAHAVSVWPYLPDAPMDELEWVAPPASYQVVSNEADPVVPALRIVTVKEGS